MASTTNKSNGKIQHNNIQKNAKQINEETDKSYQNPMYSEGLGKAYSVRSKGDSVETNPYGFTCRVTSLESTTQETMLDFAMHFVWHLPQSQGKDGIPVILFLDGHSSRWHVGALIHMMQHNVFPFFLAFHKLVWA